jgi:hypothetical protein
VRQLWEDAGYSQTQIERFGQMLVEEAAMRELITPRTPDPTVAA